MNPELLALAPVAWLLRGGLLFAGAILVDRLLRRQSAAWQAFIWRCALLVSLALAAVCLVPLKPFFPLRGSAETMATVVVDAFTSAETGLGAVTQGLARFQPSRPVIRRSGVIEAIGARAVWSWWGIGAAVVILRWLIALGQRQRYAGQARLVRDPEWLGMLSKVTAPAALPRLLRHPTTVVPCAWGMWRPTIVLPACADHWTVERRRMALEHEWSHLHRRDPVWQVLAVLVLALHWANPLAWMALRRWRLTEEEVADDAVLNQHAPDSYALLLVESARSLASGRRAATASSMAQPSTVPARVARILDPGQDRRHPDWLRCALSIAVLASCLLAILLLTPTLAAQAKSAAPTPAETARGGGEAEKVPKRLFPSAAEGTAAAEAVQEFLLADGVEAKLRFVRFPEKVAPLMRKWYATHPSAPIRSTRDNVAIQLTSLLHVGDMKFTVVTLQLLPGLDYKFYAVESTPQGLKLDWETAVGWQVMPVDEFRKTRPISPQPFRVHAGLCEYYNNGPYVDEAKWLCCELTYPGDESLRFFGYADRSSAAGKTLAKHFANRESISAILGIAYPPQGSDPKQVTIHSIISEEWFQKDGPATIDLRKGQ